MKRTGVVLVLCGLGGVACGAPPSERNAVAAGAHGFESAVRQGNGAAACALLAPSTASEVEQSAGSPCSRAILAVALRGGEVTGVTVYGGQAQVSLRRDTVFLSRFDGGWRVTAAGCTPVADKPFDCRVDGF